MPDKKNKKNQNILPILEPKNQYRLISLSIFLTICMLALICRLAYVQIFNSEIYYTKAVQQWFKEIPIHIGRGKIYDRNMIPLTNRTSIHYLVIFPEHFEKDNDNLKLLEELTEIPTHKLKNAISITKNQYIRLEIKNYNTDCLKNILSLKGVFPVDHSDRYNPNGIASHIIGHINKIDNTGAKGIEKQYDYILKENRFNKFGAIVDAQNRIIPGLGYATFEYDVKDGKKNIVTTLDYEIQKTAEDSFDKLYKKGSVVIIDIKTGDVLAIVSRPNYDQNNVAAFFGHKNNELYNRSIQVAYPPGSVFKIVIAAAALENQVLDINDTLTCTGYENIANEQIKCSSFNDGGHGTISLEQAFALSCNSAFIQIAQKTGSHNVLSMAKKFGFGVPTGINLYEETRGKLPTIDYMKGAGIANIAIGQGILEATPLQIAKMTAIIANNGIDKNINLVQKIVDDNGNIIEVTQNKPPLRVISSRTAQKIGHMMNKVITEGTASNIQLDSIGDGAGKTGSAQAVLDSRETVHAWFTGYFPYKNPQYAISIIVEDGYSGGTVAAPLFQDICKKIHTLRTN